VTVGRVDAEGRRAEAAPVPLTEAREVREENAVEARAMAIVKTKEVAREAREVREENAVEARATATTEADEAGATAAAADDASMMPPSG
jgi:hypothetical protein